MSRFTPGTGGGSGGSPNPPKPPKYDYYLTSSTAIALPICYGTARVQGNLIYRNAAPVGLFGQVPLWAQSTSYNNTAPTPSIVQANGNIYLCTTSGTSAPSGTGPSGTSTSITDGTVTWSWIAFGYRMWVAMAFCEGQVYGFGGAAWIDKIRLSNSANLPVDAGRLIFATGAPTGVAWPSWFPPITPTGEVNANTAMIILQYTAGADSSLPSLSLEVQGVFSDATHVDANPADIVNDLLTHSRRGIGWATTRLDSAGTLSAGVAASYRNYCDAYGLRLSWLIDTQSPALQLLQSLLAATNSEAIWTNRLDGAGGMLKFLPLGDQPLTANGVTYTPNTTPLYNLSENDLVQPLQIQRKPPLDTFNSFPVEYVDRSNDYRKQIVDDPDMVDVDARGLRRTSTTPLPQILSPQAAIMLSRIFAQRSCNTSRRNTYSFSLGWRYFLLEPGDILTLSDGVMGLVSVPVRVVSVEEDQQGDLFRIVAEDWPAAVSAAAQYTPQAGDGFKNNQNTAVNLHNVIPAQLPPGTVTDTGGTRGGSVDNIWPNPGSEITPPSGADATTAEWANRFNAGTGAYSGNWVRQLGQNGTLFYTLPAAPGESYYIEAQIKSVVAGANKGGYVQVAAFDANGSLLSFMNGTENDTASFVKVSASLLMPAATVKVRFGLAAGTDAAASAYFDAIYARRQIGLPLFLAEPVDATRIVASCQVLIGAGATPGAAYQTGYGGFGFDSGTAPAFVQVGLETQKRLRLTLAALPNGVSLTNCHVTAFARRMPNGITPIDASYEMLLHGWNYSANQFDFFVSHNDWSGGVLTVSHPYPWNTIDATNGSLWDILLVIMAPAPYKFF